MALAAGQPHMGWACGLPRTRKGPKSVKNYSPNTESRTPSRGHEASSRSGLGVGCNLCSSSKELRGLSVFINGFLLGYKAKTGELTNPVSSLTR